MYSELKQNIKQHLINMPGWRSAKKYIVIESDDWGAIRTSNVKSLSTLKEYGLKVNKCHYMLNDHIESEVDLEQLFTILRKYRDVNNNHPIFTANTIVANPDFEKIRESKFSEYYYELFTETYKRYYVNTNPFKLINEGISEKLYWPQLHGREHINVSIWMNDLKKGVEETMLGFDNGIYGISTTVTPLKRSSYLAAFDEGNESNFKTTIDEAVFHFEKLFGYKPKSFIAPNYVWNDEVEQSLYDNEIKYLQGSRVQQVTSINGVRKRKSHTLGEKNKYGQTYLVRNCQFEPSSDLKIDWVSNCLKEIETAFFWKKPAVISSHRVNYIGTLNPENRANNLKHLEKLLTTIIKRWPEVEFITSDTLGSVITMEKNE